MSLQQVDHSCRGVLPIMMRRCVWSGNLKNEEAMTRVGSQRHRKRKVEAVLCTLYLQTLLCLPSVCRRYLTILLVFNVQFLIYIFHLILHCFFFYLSDAVWPVLYNYVKEWDLFLKDYMEDSDNGTRWNLEVFYHIHKRPPPAPVLNQIVGSNPTGGMDVCLLWVLCVVR